ncbi:MAG: 8-amino-7-oxononanoate synthase [Bacteroidetes bacterium]|nr:8-amino-7-oxononanoate synthase [Bacteroidota bacterium]
MSELPGFSFLEDELDRLRREGLFRQIRQTQGLIDFSSNDYLGLAREIPHDDSFQAGSGASRLISGNYPLIEQAEEELATFYNTEAALLFVSGFQANIGLFQALAGRNDTLIFDELCHASIRDGIRLSHAKAVSFRHNNMDDLRLKLKSAQGNTFIITEGLFSMDGDEADLDSIAGICRESGAFLILDEAHSAGITGTDGSGLAVMHQLADICMAKIIGLGKAHGCQGGAVLGSHQLKQLLINKHRGFIFSTGMSPILASAILNSVIKLRDCSVQRAQLNRNISYYNQKISALSGARATGNQGPVQAVFTPGNELTISISESIRNQGVNVGGVRYPTVPKGSERIRIILHSFNTQHEIDLLINVLIENLHAKK